MNARAVAAVLGAITLVMGLGGLISPERTLAFVGFAPLTPSQPALALGEARAAYGGLFAMLGVFTLWGAIDPTNRRPLLLMAGFLWLGLCAGRCLGVSVDGNPGLFGWIAVLWEGGFGGALVWAALASTPTSTNVQRE